MSSNELGFDDDFMATMLGDFLDESEGYLTNLNDKLLGLEELVGALDEGQSLQADFELLNEMFRDAHSLKGLSAMLQLNDINRLTHKIENVFDAARAETLPLTRDVVDVVFRGVDCLTSMVDVLKDQDLPEVEYEAIVSEIQDLLEKEGVARSQASAEEVSETVAELKADDVETLPAQEGASNSAPETDLAEDPSLNTSEATEMEDSKTLCEVDPLVDITNETDIPDKYLAIFIDECEESLDSLCEELLADEDTQIDSVLATCHRVKGGAASIGLNRTAKMAHLMEDVLQELRDSTGHLTTEAADALMSSIDSLRAYIESLRSGTSGSDTYSEAYQQLRGALGAPGTNAEPTEPEPQAEVETEEQAEEATPEVAAESGSESALELTEEETTEIAADMANGKSGFAGCVLFDSDMPLIEIKARLICERLEECGSLFECRPEAEKVEECQGIERLVFGIVTDIPSDQLRDNINLEGVKQIQLAPISGAPVAEDVETSQESVPAATAVTEPASPQPAEPVVDSPSPAEVFQEAKPQAPAPVAPAPESVEQEQPAAPTQQQVAQKEPAPKKNEAAAKQKSDPAPAKTNKPAETLRVDIERLDHLMNLAGQLVINKARFGQVGEQLKSLASHKQSGQRLNDVSGALQRILSDAEDAVHSSTAGQSWFQGIQGAVLQINRDLELVRGDIDQLCQARTLVNDLSEAVHQLERVSDGIQKSVMDTRMVPIGPLFGRFKRVIRDITRSNGKEIQLVIRGDKTELDKRMIDELSDPLIHMVRNSADHGVEMPEDRIKAGKSRQGTVTLDAFHRGNKIFVQVKDDGKGLDPEKLKKKAIEKGIISPQDAERLTTQQALQLIWEPGFSTAEKVTDISGRGMGMDIVRSKIEQLHGAVELDSRLGEGTTITINLPLTMAILPSLLTVISDDVFAVPMESVSEIVSVAESELSTVHGLKTARVRGRVISIVELSNLLQWNKACPVQENPSGERTLVIIGNDGDELGLAVDGLLGEEDIVIKSLAENYHDVPGLAGASILGDGRVSLILDVPVLIDKASNANSQVATTIHN